MYRWLHARLAHTYEIHWHLHPITQIVTGVVLAVEFPKCERCFAKKMMLCFPCFGDLTVHHATVCWKHAGQLGHICLLWGRRTSSS